MAKLYARRLIEGTKAWKDVPDKYRDAVLAELNARVERGEITNAELEHIVN